MTWELRDGDCLHLETGLASLPTGAIDVTITDPPYSQGLYLRTATNKGVGKTGGRRLSNLRRTQRHAFALADGKIGKVDDLILPVAAELMRLTNRWILVFSDVEIAPKWRDAFGDWYIRTGVWVKKTSMPQLTGDRPAQGFETCTIAHRPGKKRWNGGGRPAVWHYATCKGSERPDHPCPKPLDLMLALVMDFTDRGELVLDPFAGSGTTGVAALRAGRRFVGWELDPGFREDAAARLTDTREQCVLFEPSKVARQLPLIGE
jgi:DNA modification methylase